MPTFPIHAQPQQRVSKGQGPSTQASQDDDETVSMPLAADPHGVRSEDGLDLSLPD